MTETYSGLPVFEVYFVAPCGSMWLHVAPCTSKIYFKGLFSASLPVV